jgi:hypothetical protein
MAFIISSVACVMSDHCPPCEGPRAEHSDAEKVHAQTHCYHAQNRTRVRPCYHFLQVLYIRVALLLLKFLTQATDVLCECIVVHLSHPLVLLIQSFCCLLQRRGCGCRHAHGFNFNSASQETPDLTSSTQYVICVLLNTSKSVHADPEPLQREC